MSLSWTDCKGKAWPCKITYGSVDDVRDAMTIDLLTIADDEGALFKEIRTKKAMLSPSIPRRNSIAGSTGTASGRWTMPSWRPSWILPSPR